MKGVEDQTRPERSRDAVNCDEELGLCLGTERRCEANFLSGISGKFFITFDIDLKDIHCFKTIPDHICP